MNLSSAHLKRYGRKALNLFTAIVPKLPTKDDTLLNKVVKAVSILDTVHDLLLHKKVLIADFVEEYDLVEHKSRPFQHLILESDFRTYFTLHRFVLSDQYTVVEAKSGFGSIYFLETENSLHPSGMANTFFVPRGVDLDDLVKKLWAQFSGKMQVSSRWVGRSGPRINVYPVAEPHNPLCGDAQPHYEELKRFHAHFTKEGLPRTYLFVGAPGTGKSSLGLRFAESLGHAVLRLDHSSISDMDGEELTFLFNLLQPTCIILDDIDKCSMLGHIDQVFYLLQRTRQENITTILTANELKQLDPALLRPERIDRIFFFSAPTEKEVVEILRFYLGDRSDRHTDLAIQQVAKACEGMTQSYIKEVALQLRYYDVPAVLGNIVSMQELLGIIQEDTKRGDQDRQLQNKGWQAAPKNSFKDWKPR